MVHRLAAFRLQIHLAGYVSSCPDLTSVNMTAYSVRAWH
jgi:hypothetical protein